MLNRILALLFATLMQVSVYSVIKTNDFLNFITENYLF